MLVLRDSEINQNMLDKRFRKTCANFHILDIGPPPDSGAAVDGLYPSDWDAITNQVEKAYMTTPYDLVVVSVKIIDGNIRTAGCLTDVYHRKY